MTTLWNILATVAWIVFWIIAGGLAWLIVAVIVGVITGRAIRGRDHHYPSPNHPAVRAHKRLTDKPYDPGPPLTPAQTAALDQLREQLR